MPIVATPLTTGGGAVDTRSAYYQELKSRIHQDLLNRLDLDRLTRMRREDAEPEIRGLIAGMVERESAVLPLSLSILASSTSASNRLTLRADSFQALRAANLHSSCALRASRFAATTCDYRR